MVLEQTKPETSPDAKTAKPKMSYFGHNMRGQGSLGKKTTMRRKTEDSRKRGSPGKRWGDSIKVTLAEQGCWGQGGGGHPSLGVTGSRMRRTL